MTEKPIYVAKDAQGRWCACMLNEKTCGTPWLLLDEGKPTETVASAIFVFTGKGPPHMMALIQVIGPEALERLAASQDPIARKFRADVERAVTLDSLVHAPPWIRLAVKNELDARRARGTEA